MWEEEWRNSVVYEASIVSVQCLPARAQNPCGPAKPFAQLHIRGYPTKAVRFLGMVAAKWTQRY